jgi:hypothetical protein
MDSQPRRSRGGSQPYSGRPTRYPNKISKGISIWLTAEGRHLLDQCIERNGASVSDIIEALIREYGATLVLPPLPTREQMKRMRGAPLSRTPRTG